MENICINDKIIIIYDNYLNEIEFISMTLYYNDLIDCLIVIPL